MKHLLKLLGLCFILTPVTAYGAIYRVGVMDFSNLSQDRGQDWVCEAFSSAVAEKLQRVSNFSVLSRKRLWEIQGDVDRAKETNPQEAKVLAQESRLDYLVFGSVQRAGDINMANQPLRVHARLVDTVRGVIHQAVVMDGNMSDLFDLQYRLTEAFVKQASIEISVAEREAMKTPEALSLEAYRLFNIGMLEKRVKRYKEAITAFEKAMSKHPGILYGDAHHQIGLVYLAMGRKSELLVRFKNDVAKLAPVYYDLGLALRQNGNYDKAAEAFKTFVESTDRYPYLWEYDFGNLEHHVYLDAKRKVIVLSNGTQLLALDALSGEKQWSKKQSKGAGYQVESPGMFVPVDAEGEALDMISGNASSVGRKVTQRLTEDDEDEVQILVENNNLVVRESGKPLWIYQSQEEEEIIGHNRDTFFIRKGKRHLRALKIQRETIPNQADGLLQMAKCLELGSEPQKAKEVYDYLMDLSLESSSMDEVEK